MVPLYHRVPRNLIGTTLFPLNMLKDLYPEVYHNAVKKYEGREIIMEDVIPLLNCKWNDVIHLSPIHPQELEDAFVALGRQGLKGREFFCVDAMSLNPQNTVVYLYQNETRAEKFMEGNFIPFDPLELTTMSHLPEGTKKYYAEAFSQGEDPLLWYRAPHILYRGTIDTESLQRISIK